MTERKEGFFERAAEKFPFDLFFWERRERSEETLSDHAQLKILTVFLVKFETKVFFQDMWKLKTAMMRILLA
jgi:hypothetical protein